MILIVEIILEEVMEDLIKSVEMQSIVLIIGELFDIIESIIQS